MASSVSGKLKVLLFGTVGDETDALIEKVAALHGSKAGPFDAAFCVGPVNVARLLQNERTLTIPTYLQDDSLREEPNPSSPKSDWNHNAPEDCNQNFVPLAENLYLLRTPEHPAAANVWSLSVAPRKPALVVVACPARFRVDQTTVAQPLLDQLRHVSYTGCDLLLTTEAPQGMESIIGSESVTPSFPTPGSALAVSYDVAEVALLARARYHVVPSPNGLFQQSPAFAHLSATTHTTNTLHVGRVLTLGPVQPVTDWKIAPKTHKFVHALGLQPLHQQSITEQQGQRPAHVLTNPFTDTAYQRDGPPSTNGGHNSGLSEASARRILAEEQHKRSGGDPSQRWSSTGPHRPKRSRENDYQEQNVDLTCRTLFLHGLHKDVSGQLQSATGGDQVLLQALASFGAEQIRRPPQATTSSFCFCEFGTHDQALQCLQTLGGSLTVHGVLLTVKWATTVNAATGPDGSNPKRQRLTEPEARESSTIHYKLPPQMLNGPNSPSHETVAETLRTWMEHTLEYALASEDDTDHATPTVQAADEPALQVQKRLPSDEAMTFGFLDFASHAAASMALATLTGSTDGGRVTMENAKRVPEVFKSLWGGSAADTQPLYLNWARPKEADVHNIIEDASGFKFERRHFPADARKDCWFCLASEACEKHLITGVYQSCYAAMPKGPVHQGHVLLIPVKHSSQGALKDSIVAQEMDALKSKLRKHAYSVYDSDLFVFERAIQTKGGYHTHVQCVPVPKRSGIQLQSTMIAQARKTGMQLRELTSDLALAAMFTDEDNEGGYFYAEIPLAGTDFKRFLYKADGQGQTPLQFGREVIAAVLGKPSLAHWKSCLLDREEETAMASLFRESFEKFCLD
ncbi:predicted protein [Phaeodactylum tricornutum CCAP 1055/1]|uniref:Uncharacterized protein n=1 Tax=Phaeodactylum tricornutum (strain CCAP 1055/1) TaxID=556484 RepID=B7G9N0_PHATC|nr:predicted protein [Phaeodactylum tricornutum CCAP 1055/1]EEC44471.1 predicted protein [Phaeodactylum tricornutum CCAP 1055/1]|eukprot:XP_002183802.1 predicted protein [Phaeodactylum tricornutum CCAP 1055/1]